MRPEEIFSRNVHLFISAAMREARERKGLSMLAVAERAGLSQQMVSYVERNIRIPSLDTLLRISNVLGLNLGEIIQAASAAAKKTAKK